MLYSDINSDVSQNARRALVHSMQSARVMALDAAADPSAAAVLAATTAASSSAAAAATAAAAAAANGRKRRAGAVTAAGGAGSTAAGRKRARNADGSSSGSGSGAGNNADEDDDDNDDDDDDGAGEGDLHSEVIRLPAKPYDAVSRLARLQRWLEKRARILHATERRVIYQCRKEFADERPRIGGRFIRKVRT